MEYRKKEIISKLNAESELFVQWYLNRNNRILEKCPEGAWTAGQHLLHMIKSTEPLAKGLGYPWWVLRLKFGKAKVQSSSYEDLIERYLDKIENGAKASGAYVPRDVKWEEKEVLISRFKTEKSIMVNNLSKWSEKHLDNIAVPHPLLGNITLREMMYFTIYHTHHHTAILEKKYV